MGWVEGLICGYNLPLDGEPGNTWLIGQDVSANLLDDRLGRRIGIQLFCLVLIVDVVSNSNELAAVV